ncbi:unnamed protein product [Rotaria sordida]|uniref:GIY-YIG domain-containing protein n=1 Tax=Rotaria sordida TaxID=392033 RepID=A0A819PT87_9BILA|nr:unnamed protein product [Rotaria sordida]
MNLAPKHKLFTQVNPPMETKTNSIVYQSECDCGAMYVGETKIGSTKRIKQHETLIKQDDKKSNSEMAIHAHNNKHQCKFDTSSAIIIEKETNIE